MERLRSPLLFERICLEKVWGGRALEERPGLALPPGADIGETWEIVDREDEQSVVRAGPLSGSTLGELVRDHRDELLGNAPSAAGGRFPLLIKYLDAREALSVQVHPDEAAARRLGKGAESKTEAWYFLDGRTGGAVWSGLRAGVERDQLVDALGQRSLVDLLERYAATPGTALTVRGGTIHAIGAGVTLLEVQQNSDTTYRLYDWDRPGLDGEPRELHLQAGLAATRVEPASELPMAPRWETVGERVRCALLARTDHFAMRRWTIEGACETSTAGSFRIWAAIEGCGRIQVRGAGACELAPGDVALVPAVAGALSLESEGGALDWIELYHPS